MTLVLVMLFLALSATAFANGGDAPQAPAHPEQIIETL
jgi:hypothetical protein